MVAYALLFATAALASAALSSVLVGIGRRVGIVDHPGERKVHLAPVPRLGGVAIALALTLALGVSVLLEAQALVPAAPDPKSLLPIITGAVLVFAIGLWDDIDPVAPSAKLSVELIAALIVVGSGIAIRRVTLAGTTYEICLLAAALSVCFVALAAIIGATTVGAAVQAASTADVAQR